MFGYFLMILLSCRHLVHDVDECKVNLSVSDEQMSFLLKFSSENQPNFLYHHVIFIIASIHSAPPPPTTQTGYSYNSALKRESKRGREREKGRQRLDYTFSGDCKRAPLIRKRA
uniref:Uncharacterized protein n=1 Tax=Caenorhabditis japonica TaxID=281687 RepID=A0A8R1ILP7_CAEJA